MITKSLQTILNAASVWGEKGKDRMTLIISLINLRIEEVPQGCAIEDLKELV